MSDLIDRQAVRLAKVPYDEQLSEYERGWNDACEAIADNVPSAPRWVRCEDELPEIGKIVLVYDDWDRLSICQLDKQYRWLRQGGGWFDVPYVRYWMPIEPPKEDA